MLIAVDIGNSTISFAFMKNGRVERAVSIENMPDSALVIAKLDNFLESVVERYKIKDVLICSVVPDTLTTLQAKIEGLWCVKSKVVDKDIKIPIRNKYAHPRQVGKDRLLCAFAARELHGSPAVIIDSGTAITFDGLSVKGDYLGGAIIPGLRLSAEALFDKTALLPRVRMTEPERVIGRSTDESIRSGLFHGYGALCDGMVLRLGKEMKCEPKVIMTGGHAALLSKFMTCPIHAIEEHLIFKGMFLLL